VGITEQFETSMLLFARMSGLPEPAVVPHLNCNPDRHTRCYDLEPGCASTSAGSIFWMKSRIAVGWNASTSSVASTVSTATIAQSPLLSVGAA
jgi:hypothetical protein